MEPERHLSCVQMYLFIFCEQYASFIHMPIISNPFSPSLMNMQAIIYLRKLFHIKLHFSFLAGALAGSS